MKTFYSNLFAHVKELQKVAVATLTLLIILLSTINSYSQVLDTTFGVNGIMSIPKASYVTSSVQYFDFDEYGNIITVGVASKFVLFGNPGYDMTITKTDENGNLIPSFGNNGVVRVTEYYNSYPSGLKITDDNKILILARCEQPNETVLIQFNGDGTRDTNYAPNGKIIINTNNPTFVNFENEFMLIGYNDSISKYDYNGILDTNFGIGGTVNLQFNHYYAKSLSDSSIIVAGAGVFGLSQKELAICKLKSNGDIDTTFAQNGVWHLNICLDSYGNYEYLNYVIEENNGELVFSGSELNKRSIVCKFSSTGVIDISFGNKGFYFSNISNYMPLKFVLKNENKYITGNYSNVISINNNGTPDNSFGNNGYFSLANNLNLFAMKLQGKNKIVLGGSSSNNFALTRLIIDTMLTPSHTIRGKVTFNDKGLTGVTLSCPNCLTQTEITDQSGKYEFEVTKGINAKIEPSLIGYTFAPTDTTITNITQNIYNVNFLAIDTTTLLPKTYTVSGNITMNGNPLANVLIDTTTIIITAKSVLITDENGYYEINDIPENRSLTIIPTLEGYKFDPPSYTFTATSNETVNFIAEEDVTGIKNQQINNIALYPNPVKDNLNFTEATQVEITDMQGRVLLRTTKAVKTVNISNLQAGIYFVRVTLSNQSVEMIKIVKL